MGGDFRGGKRHRREDGSHMRVFKPTVGNNGPVAGNRELQEMREAIIHCDGSPEMMKHLSGLLAQDLPALNEPASEFVLECVQNLPVKTPVYATLVAMLNHSSGEFVEEVVRATCEQLETTLASTSLDDRIKARLLLRFIAVWPVVGIVTASAAVDILDAVVCAAVDAADKGEPGWQPRADYLAYAVLAALPWGGAALQTAKEFDVMMDSIEDYLRKRRQGPDPAAMLFAPPAGSAADTVDDWLEECWGRVNEVRKAGAQDDASWSVKSIPPVTDIITGDSFELGGGAHHTPPPLKVAEMSFSGAAEALAAYPVRPRLRILPQEQTEGLWDAGDWGPLERFVTEEYIADTLWAFEPGFRRETTIPAADQMGTLPLPADHPERCQFLVAETLFGEMLALPRPAHETVFYHIVIQDLCKAIPSFPKMMAKVVGQMFRQIGRMEFEARERLADWMAHHLSCFDLAWPWQSWVHVADQPSNHPQRTFCNSVVRRLCRLSYYDRVKESLPDELHCLVPNTPALNPDYILETLNGSSGALRDLQAFMKEKKPAGEVMEWLKTSGKLDALGRAGAAKALTVAALQHGQKCITHHNVLLKRYESALVELTKSDAEAGEDGCADVMVAAAAGVWAGAHPHMAVTAVSRLLELGLVAPNDVATWVQKSIDDETAAGTDEDGASRGVAWGTADAWDIACLAVETVAADREDREWRANAAKRKVDAAEAQAARAAADADRAASQGRHVDAGRAKEAIGRIEGKIAKLRAEMDDAALPVEHATAQLADSAGALCLALVKSLAPKLGDAAAAAAGPTPAEVGKDAEPEPRDARALAMCVAALRRFRSYVGAEYEGKVREALGGASTEVATVLGEAMSGRVGFNGAGMIE